MMEYDDYGVGGVRVVGEFLLRFRLWDGSFFEGRLVRVCWRARRESEEDGRGRRMGYFFIYWSYFFLF